MHGRKRSKRAAVSAEELRLQREKLGKLRALGDIALRSYAAKDLSDTSFDLTTKLLSVNPDFATLWNFRRSILLSRWDALARDSLAEAVQAELRLTAEAISSRNPKSYSAWYHRKWVVTRCCKADESKDLVDLKGEIKLCEKLLEADERNFHCWSYRAFVLKEIGPVDSEQELQFAASLIERNFSNYAAWNLRSLHVDASDPDTLKREFELLQDAVFTEPADQSCWIYHRWLVKKVVEEGNGMDAKVKREIVEGQVAMCRELLSVEEGCKWGMLTLARLLLVLQREGDGENVAAEVQELCSQLINVDPVHKGYYMSILRA